MVTTNFTNDGNIVPRTATITPISSPRFLRSSIHHETQPPSPPRHSRTLVEARLLDETSMPLVPCLSPPPCSPVEREIPVNIKTTALATTTTTEFSPYEYYDVDTMARALQSLLAMPLSPKSQRKHHSYGINDSNDSAADELKKNGSHQGMITAVPTSPPMQQPRIQSAGAMAA